MASDRTQADSPKGPDQPTRLFHVVDPNLRDVVGHYYAYDRAVSEGAAAHGYKPVIMAHRDVEPAIARRIGAHGVFTRDIWGLSRRKNGLVGRLFGKLRDNARFLLDLRRALRQFGLTPGSVVLAHTFTDRQFLGLALLPLAVPGARDVRFVFLLRYQPDFYQGPISSFAFSIIASLARFRRIYLTTDSQRLGEQLGLLTSCPVHVLPIPHVPPMLSEARVRDPKTTPCFVCLGDARDEKGILEILDAIRILHDRGQSDGLRFILQCNDANPDIQAAIDAFRALNISGCDLLPDKLESDDYYRLLQAADIVLLPYWRSIYFARTSGVFMEALSVGKPVIATAGTWMSDQLETLGAGIVTPDRSPEDLADAIQQAASMLVPLTEKASRDRDHWRATHNPNALVAAIDALSDTPRPAASPPVNALILYPHNDFLSRQSGASRRVNLLADFLRTNGLRVRVVHDDGTERVVQNGISAEWLGPERRRLMGRLWTALVVYVLSLGRGMAHRWMFWQYARTNNDAQLERRLRQHIRWADVVMLEYPFWARIIARITRQERRPLVMTPYDVLSDQLTGHPALHALGWSKERRAWGLADHLVAVSSDDRDRMAGLGLSAVLSPNPTDGRLFEVDRLRGASDILRDVFKISLPAERFCLFVGSRFEPNIRAVEAIRRIAVSLPDVGFVIAGGCAEPERSANLLALGRVTDAELLLLHAACTIVLIPIPFGTGASLKTVEGMAAGRVVLGTSAAFRGLDVVPDQQVVIEDSIDAYPARIQAILADTNQARSMARAAQAFARAYDSRIAYRPYLPLIGMPNPDDAMSDPTRTMINPSLLLIAQSALDAGHPTIAHDLAREVLRSSPGDAAAETILRSRDLPVSTPKPDCGGTDPLLSRATDHEDTPPVSTPEPDCDETDPILAWAKDRDDTWSRYYSADHEIVIARATEVLRHDDRLAEAHYLLAESVRLLDDNARALFHYTAALRYGYPVPLTRFGRSQSRLALGDGPGALRDLVLTIMAKPVTRRMPRLLVDILRACVLTMRGRGTTSR